MPAFDSRFARRFVRPTGALELMEDLGSAGPGVHMLGGGNPARIPAVEAVYRRRLVEIAGDAAQFGRFVASYSAPGGDVGFRATVAGFLAARYGWPLTERNVVLTGGSQSAFFTLFNLLAGESAAGGPQRVLLPLAPEYIGYADLGLTDGMLVAQAAAIEELPDGFFKYHVRFDGLEAVPDVAAICVSRPTNPSGNVLSLDELQRLDGLARKRRVPLIVDAAYGQPFPGIQFSEPGLLWNENVILCLSLSKLGLPATRTGIVVAAESMVEAITAFNATAALAPGSTGPVIVEPLLASGELDALCREVIRPYYRSRAAKPSSGCATTAGTCRCASTGRRARSSSGCGFRGCRSRARNCMCASRPVACSCCRGITFSRASRTPGRIATSVCASTARRTRRACVRESG